MKKWTPLFLLLAAFIATCKSPSQEHDQNFTSGQLDSLFNYYERHELYFISAQINKSGESFFQRSAGYEDLENGKKLDASSVFLIGSITKTYTAVMIMQLIGEGKLQLTDKLSQFYPGVPNAEKIDLEMLLRHRSGLFNYTASSQFITNVTRPVSKTELLEIFSGLKIVFPPDTRFEYSNTNYVLLGFIVEDVTGDTYASQLKTRILDPLDLTHTYFGRPRDRAHFAASYSYRNGKWVKESQWDTGWALGAGAISATVDDVSAFFEGLFTGRLISKESLQQMMELRDGYGIGLMPIPYGTKTYYGHNGGIENYRSICAWNPKDSIMLTQISNATFDGKPNDITVQMLNAINGNPVRFPDTLQKTFVTVPLKLLNAYEGTYSAPGFPLKIRIFVKDSTLYGQATGQPEFPLTAHSDTKFGFAPAALSMEFALENDGPKFHFKQGSAEFDFARLTDEPAHF